MTSLSTFYFSDETESIHSQLSSKIIYCHRLEALLVLKLYFVIGLKNYAN